MIYDMRYPHIWYDVIILKFIQILKSILSKFFNFHNPASSSFEETTDSCTCCSQYNDKSNSYNLNARGWGKGIEDIVGNDDGY